MKNLQLSAKQLAGTITIHASKSLTHRLLIAAALANGKSTINNFYPSNDIMTTLKALQDMGLLTFNISGSVLTINGGLKQNSSAIISCNESGTTFRLLIPIVIAKGINTSFQTQNRLSERPINHYLELFKEHNITMQQQRNVFSFKGSFISPQLNINGSKSSQFISGLLMSLPLLMDKSFVHHTSNLVSKNYIDLTIDALNIAGVKIYYENNSWYLDDKHNKYQPFTTTIEGDYSNAAWYFTANSLGQNIDLKGLNENSSQGDSAILSLLKQIDNDENPNISCQNVIDLVPLLALKASLTVGKTTILTDVERLKDKESNRLSAIVITLKQLGVDLSANEKSLTIKGQKDFVGEETFDSFNDHRIAMMIALASLYCQKPIILNDADATSKSYPNFWDDFKSIGGEFCEHN